MLFRFQTLFFAAVLIASLFLTRVGGNAQEPSGAAPQARATSTITTKSVPLSFPTKLPTRKWDVPDPQLTAHAVLLQSLDDNMPLYYKNIRGRWPLASLTKLLSAVAVEENIGLDKTIPITQEAVNTEGIAGDLKSGESYLAKDLMNIMLLVSSNDAAAAFEEYDGGTDKFAALLNQKAKDIGLSDTVVYDGSGLNDSNEGTAEDVLKLMQYILANHPDILYATQSPDLIVEPLNSSEPKHLYNIDQLSDERGFLGGKTGTSPKADENLAAVFTRENRRMVVILLGSTNRVADTDALLNWVEKAYTFP